MQDPPAPPVVFTDSESMLQHGTHVLHEQLAAHLEVALGKPLPQMEVRFKHVSITAEVVVTEDQQSKNELPTLVNTVKKAFMGLSAKKRVVHKEILHDVSGTFKPGTITLVLGQPGSGKSSLMKLLTGRFPRSKNVDVQGEMTYNGTPQSELTKQLPQFVSYVTQRDNHFPTLTVKETLEFAHHCCGGELPAEVLQNFSKGTPDENKRAIDAARAIYEHRPDMVLRQLLLPNSIVPLPPANRTSTPLAVSACTDNSFVSNSGTYRTSASRTPTPVDVVSRTAPTPCTSNRCPSAIEIVIFVFKSLNTTKSFASYVMCELAPLSSNHAALLSDVAKNTYSSSSLSCRRFLH